MKYSYNDKNDLELFTEVFGKTWETAAELDREIGAFLLIDDGRRAVLDDNAVHCFGFSSLVPEYDELKELVSGIYSISADIAIKLLDAGKGLTAGFVYLKREKELNGYHPELCTHKEFTRSAVSVPDSVIMMIHIEGVEGGGNYESCIFTAVNAIVSALPEDALITKHSENEFRLFLPNFKDDPIAFAKELDNRVRSSPVINRVGTVLSEAHPMRLRIGICTDRRSLAFKINSAELALFEAQTEKSSGIEIFSAERYESSRNDYVDLVKFSRLLGENLFVYHFQPIVNAHNGDIVAYEALMRTDPSIGYNPLEVLDIAEKRGKLYDIEVATLKNTLAALSENQHIFDDRKLFINSIPSQLLTEEDFAAIRADYGELFEKIVVEFTEHDEVDDASLAKVKDRLRDSRMKMAIDDYGTGFSNHSNLMRYSPDFVKIDRSLISDIDTDPKKQMLVSGMIDFLHSTGCLALAEGIETSGELHTLIKMSIDLLQGFYISRPKPILLNEISDNLHEEILAFNLEAQGKIQKLYHTAAGEKLDLKSLALRSFTNIFIDGGDITITGEPDKFVRIPITVKENAECRINLKNVCIEPDTEIPAITLSAGSRTRLVCYGSNVIKGSCISVPEGASLEINGFGDLSVLSNHTDCCAIGDLHDRSFGDITINTHGRLNVSASGEYGICIGGGHGGSIKLEGGDINAVISSAHAVGIGSWTGKTDIYVHDCALTVSGAASDAVLVGSLKGTPVITLHNIACTLKGEGGSLCAVGSLEGSSSWIKAHDMKLGTNLHCRNVINVGSFMGDSECLLERMELNLYSEGGTVIGIGSGDGGETVIRSCELNLTFLSGNCTPIGSPNGSTELSDIIKNISLNE